LAATRTTVHGYGAVVLLCRAKQQLVPKIIGDPTPPAVD